MTAFAVRPFSPSQPSHANHESAFSREKKHGDFLLRFGLLRRTNLSVYGAPVPAYSLLYLCFLPLRVGEDDGVAAVAAGRDRRAERKAEDAAARDSALLHKPPRVAGSEGAVPLAVIAVEVGHVFHHRQDGYLFVISHVVFP